MERRRYTCDGKPDGRWIAVMIPGLELSFRMALMDDDIHTHTHTHTHLLYEDVGLAIAALIWEDRMATDCHLWIGRRETMFMALR